MERTDRYALRSSDVACEDFDGEFVVLDIENGRYFSLLGGAALVWRGITSGHSAETLCAGIDAGDPRRAAVVALIEQLLGHGLIVAASSTIGEPPRDIAFQLAKASGPFEVNMFDDLADLLVADPIHDVDEDTGWPVVPAKQA